jgi:hypothetical protein
MNPATRADKFMDYSLASLDGVDELKDLRAISRRLFFLPFEINSKIPLQL